MTRVLIADAVSQECDRVLAGYGIEVERAVGVPVEELHRRVAGFDGMIVRSAVQVDGAMMEHMDRMRVIGRAGAGVDNIDVGAATDRGIIVMNTPGGNTISAAEHTMAMMLAVMRRIPAANASLRAGSWDRKSFTGSELFGKRVGVLGLGRIGREVASRLRAFGAEVLGHDPAISADVAFEPGIALVGFDELVERSDIITIHIPLTSGTRGIIGAAELGRMPRGVYLINAARGGIVDEAALVDALASGQVAGAAVDVFDGEPPSFPNALIEHPRVVATPHIAASTEEAQTRVAIDIAHQVAELLGGKGARGVVNADGLEAALAGEAAPLMDLAATLGALLGQLAGSDEADCRLVAHGVDPAIMRGLGRAFLAGLVRAGGVRGANVINAPAFAERRSIALGVEAGGEHDEFDTLLAADVLKAGRRRSAAMAQYGRSGPRLVMVDGARMEIRPSGAMLLAGTGDGPGVPASIVAAASERGVNIFEMAVGSDGGGRAVTAMRVDRHVPELLEHLCSLKVVHWAESLDFGNGADRV